MLLYRKLLDNLESREFSLNTYDPWVVNNMIGGKQLTITWNVDYLKLSHVDKKVVEEMIERMKGIYGQYMRISRGKKHDYLRMILDFSVRVKVAVTMVDYLKGIISDFEEMETLTGTATSPAAEHLYAIRDKIDQKKLDEKRATEFHHDVAQLLFAFPRAQTDTHTTVSFLTKRVRIPDEDNWEKLKRIIR